MKQQTTIEHVKLSLFPSDHLKKKPQAMAFDLVEKELIEEGSLNVFPFQQVDIPSSLVTVEGKSPDKQVSFKISPEKIMVTWKNIDDSEDFVAPELGEIESKLEKLTEALNIDSYNRVGFISRRYKPMDDPAGKIANYFFKEFEDKNSKDIELKFTIPTDMNLDDDEIEYNRHFYVISGEKNISKQPVYIQISDFNTFKEDKQEWSSKRVLKFVDKVYSDVIGGELLIDKK